MQLITKNTPKQNIVPVKELEDGVNYYTEGSYRGDGWASKPYVIKREGERLVYLSGTGIHIVSGPGICDVLNPVKLDWAKVKIDISEATP